MEWCEILIVEDDANTVDTWKRDIVDFNRAEGTPFKYHAIYAGTKTDALQVLRRTRIDCAVVDLRLPDGEIAQGVANPAIGNAVLEELLLEVGVPAVVYSGYANEVNQTVKSSKIRVLSKKGGGGAAILEMFAEQAGLILAMEETRKRIARETADLFNKSIWARWESAWKSEGDRDLVAGIIARQTASYIADRLALPPFTHHPDEFYVVPPLFVDRLDTGDLLKFDGGIYVVLTPRCNMAYKQPEHLLLALCRPMTEEWSELKKKFSGDREEKKSAEFELRNYATQGHAIASHFFPPCGDEGPWLVDFKEVRTISSKLSAELISARIASTAPHFVPNLVQRYAAYFGRIGQPDIDRKILKTMCVST